MTNRKVWLPVVLFIAACESPLVSSLGLSRPTSTAAEPSPTVSGQTPAPTATVTPVTGVVSGTGGTVSDLAFAITGDTRPAALDDTSAYPTSIIGPIWKDIADEGVPFALAAGDYLQANSNGEAGVAQLQLYMAARAAFPGVVFPVMGNHECDNNDDSANCGPGKGRKKTENYKAFVSQMLDPIGQVAPNFSVRIDATDGSWTSKFVMVSGNSWTSADSTWLEAVLSSATTYTFIVRHQDVTGTDAPGVIASAPIMAEHPYTLLLCAHKHTFEFDPASKQVITGNGGAPPDSSIDYGYTVIRRQPDGTLIGNNYDYLTHAVLGTFHVDSSGAVVP